jgi:hypothetical protein
VEQAWQRQWEEIHLNLHNPHNHLNLHNHRNPHSLQLVKVAREWEKEIP